MAEDHILQLIMIRNYYKLLKSNEFTLKVGFMNRFDSILLEEMKEKEVRNGVVLEAQCMTLR